MIVKSHSWDQFVLLDEDLENNNDEGEKKSIMKSEKKEFKINNSYEPYTYWGDIIAKTVFTGWLVYILFAV